MNLQTTTKTIEWMNKQLDQIQCRAEFLGELVQEEENPEILFFLETKLKALDRQCVDIGKKIDFEKKQLFIWKGKE